MTITIESLIRAGAMAQKIFSLREDYEIRLFPSDSPEIVKVWETPKPIYISRNEFEKPSPFAPMPNYDEVKLTFFGSSYNNDLIRMGYSEGLNILCLSL